MKMEKLKFGAGRLIGNALVGVMVLGVVPQGAMAAVSDDQFRTYIQNICDTVSPPNNWDLVNLTDMCLNASGAFALPAGTGVSANLGSVNAEGGVSSRKKRKIDSSTRDDEATHVSASADSGAWGVLIAPQYGRNNRLETVLESGYKSNLTGLGLGLDYRFSDAAIIGVLLNRTTEKASFFNDAGTLDSSNDSAIFYGTWLITSRVSVDGYLGLGKLNLETRRDFIFGPSVAGKMIGSTSGQQTMGGVSVTRQFGSEFDLSANANFDYIKTDLDAYSEAGSNVETNLMALRYNKRSVLSSTLTVGLRGGKEYGYKWGLLIPSLRLAAVHEFQNNSRQVSNELVLTPGTSLQVETDSPDRNYLNVGLGVAAALNTGAQFFLDFEKRTQDKLLSSWAVSVGGLFEF